jgi:predicted DNA binding CopG/RHH family protein
MEQRKDRWVGMRASKETYQHVKDKAKKEGLTISAFVEKKVLG